MSIRSNCTLPQLAELFRREDQFAVLSHIRPDGDAIGSTLALGLALRALGKNVIMINEDGVPEGLRFLAGSETILRPQDFSGLPAVRVAIAVDCANRERLGKNALALLESAPHWVNIDHHKSNEGYGDQHFIEWHSPATGQILFDFLQATDLPLTPEIAAALYVAISTDTGSFQFDSVTPRTYEIAAAIMRLGVNIAELNRQTYANYPLRRISLLRGLLNTMEISHQGRVGLWCLTQELAKEVEALPEDAEGLIDTLRSIQGVVIAIHLEELADGKIRVSLRSQNPNMDVGAVAAKFGGGGHVLAAGIRMAGPLVEAKTRLLNAITEIL